MKKLILILLIASIITSCKKESTSKNGSQCWECTLSNGDSRTICGDDTSVLHVTDANGQELVKSCQKK